MIQKLIKMQVVRFVDLTGEENNCAKCGIIFTDCICVTFRPLSPDFDLELASDDDVDQMDFDCAASYFGSDSDSDVEVIRNNLDSFGPAPNFNYQDSENAQFEVNQSLEESTSPRKSATEIVRQIATISMKSGQNRMRTQRGSQLPYRKFTYEEVVSLARARGDTETHSLLDSYSNYWRPSGARRARN